MADDGSFEPGVTPYHRPEPAGDEGDRPLLPGQERMGAGRLMGISAFWFAANFHWTAMLAVLMPRQIAEMTGRLQSETLGWLIGGGAVFPLLVPLLVGPLSDRCMSRLGRRRPFLFAGVTVNIAGLIGMLYFSTAGRMGTGPFGLPLNFWGYAVGFIIVQIGNNVATGAYQGVIPDVVLPSQRGVASGYMGFMTQLGSALGIIAVAIVFRNNVLISYGLIIAMLVICVLGTSSALREKPLERQLPPLNAGAFLKSLWIDPRKFPDFWWVWITRALVMFGFYIVQPFVRYYLRDVIHIANDKLDIVSGVIFLIILVAATITGLVGGWLSDRVGRKRIVYWANGIMAVAAIALVFCGSLVQASSRWHLFWPWLRRLHQRRLGFGNGRATQAGGSGNRYGNLAYRDGVSAVDSNALGRLASVYVWQFR